MSIWTYVHGTVVVRPFGRTQAEKRYILETVLEHLPRVYGSEGDMEVYVIQERGYSTSCSADEFLENTDKGIDRYGCRSREGWFETQDEYILVLDGNLRDRMYSETFKSLTKWLVRLSKRVPVRDVQLKVWDGVEKSFITNESGRWTEMWTGRRDDDENWCEYLMWDRPRDKDGNLLGGKPSILDRKGEGYYYE